MIAVKREVAAIRQVFPWSECQVRKLTTSHCTNLTAVETKVNAVTQCESTMTHTEMCTVTACRTRKVRKGGDFFYGKSSNENHIESL